MKTLTEKLKEIQADKNSWVFHLTHNDADALGCDLVLRVTQDLPVCTCFCSAGVLNTTKVVAEFINIMKERKDMLYYLRHIYITDISVSDSDARDLVALSNLKMHDDVVFVHGYDHHPSNTLYTISPIFRVRTHINDPIIGRERMSSAAELMFQEMFETRHLGYNPKLQYQFSALILSISLYDTWEWTKSDVRSAKDYPLIKNIDDVQTLPVCCNDFGIEYVAEYYYKVLDDWKSINWDDDSAETVSPLFYPEPFYNYYQMSKLVIERNYERAKYNIKFGCIDEHIVAFIVGTTSNTNAIVNKMYDDFPFVDFFMMLFPETCTVGLRTDKNDINLSKICKRLWNGGGHPKAAGATLGSVYFPRYMEIYWDTALTAKDLYISMNKRNEVDENIEWDDAWFDANIEWDDAWKYLAKANPDDVYKVITEK